MKIKALLLLITVIYSSLLIGQTDDMTSNLYNTYDKFKESSLDKRRIKHENLKPLIAKFSKNSKFKVTKVGESIQGRDLSLISIGSGKTNVFRAIRLLLEDTSLHYSYKLTENDFNRVLDGDSWKGHWIIISIEFNEITDEEAIQSLFIHGAGVAEEDYVKKASYNLFFRPKADIRQRLCELAKGDTIGLNKILEEITIFFSIEFRPCLSNSFFIENLNIALSLTFLLYKLCNNSSVVIFSFSA